MSHDFPDGPDWNPEPLDDDPWNVATVSHPVCCPECENTMHDDDGVWICGTCDYECTTDAL